MANTEKYLNHLLQSTGITPACSEEERAAADIIAGIFKSHGFEPEVQEFTASAGRKTVQAVLGVLAFLGAVLMGIGGVVGALGALIAILSAVLYLFERTGHAPISRMSSGGYSQNVVAYHKASGPLASPRNRPVVVVAHYDSPRADILSRLPFANYRGVLNKVVPFCMVIPAVLSVVRLLPVPNVVKIALWVAAIVVALVPLLNAVAVLISRFATPYTSGAVCNKSSVAAMLGVMDQVAPYNGVNEFPEDIPFDEYMDEQQRIAEELAAPPVYPEPEGDVVLADGEDQEGSEAAQDPYGDIYGREFAEPDDRGYVEEGYADETRSVVDAPYADVRDDLEPALEQADETDAPLEGSTVQMSGDAIAAALDAASAVASVGGAFDGVAHVAEAVAPAAAEAAVDAVATAVEESIDPLPRNNEGNIRFGADALRGLGMLPESCAFVYDDAQFAPLEPVSAPQPVPVEEPAVAQEVPVAYQPAPQPAVDPQPIVEDVEAPAPAREELAAESTVAFEPVAEPVPVEDEVPSFEEGLEPVAETVQDEEPADDLFANSVNGFDAAAYEQVAADETYGYAEGEFAYGDDDRYIDADYDGQGYADEQLYQATEGAAYPEDGIYADADEFNEPEELDGTAFAEPEDYILEAEFEVIEEPIEETVENEAPIDDAPVDEVPEPQEVEETDGADVEDSISEMMHEEVDPVLDGAAADMLPVLDQTDEWSGGESIDATVPAAEFDGTAEWSVGEDEDDYVQPAEFEEQEEGDFDPEVEPEPDFESEVDSDVEPEAEADGADDIDEGVEEELVDDEVEPLVELADDSVPQMDEEEVFEEDASVEGEESVEDDASLSEDIESEEEGYVEEETVGDAPEVPAVDVNGETEMFDMSSVIDGARGMTQGFPSMPSPQMTGSQPVPMQPGTTSAALGQTGVRTIRQIPAIPGIESLQQQGSPLKRVGLVDLPDPSVAPSDPFAALDSHFPSPASTRGFSVVSSTSAQPPVNPEPKPLETISAPLPIMPSRQQKQEQAPRRGLGRLFGRKKKRDEDTGWNPEDFEGDNGWKGGAAGDMALSELQDAITSMGDDELLGHDIWFVATGASEYDNAGIKHFLEAHRDNLRGVFVINLESVGSGQLAMVSTEGENRVLRADRRIKNLLSRVASDFHHQLAEVDMPYLNTDAYAAMSMSRRSCTVAGVDGSRFACSHTEEDQPLNLDVENVERVANIVTEVIRRS